MVDVTLYLRRVPSEARDRFMQQARDRGMTPSGWFAALVVMGDDIVMIPQVTVSDRNA
jgi:hypothetical protein